MGEARRHFRSAAGRSVSSLLAIQIASYLLPLISFPYLLRVLGPEQFGLYAFTVAVARYGLLITDWGFPYTATRDIAARRARGESVDGVYSRTLIARVVLLGACAVIVAVVTTTSSRFGDDASLYWAALAGIAGSALFPTWIFQAFERLPLVTIANLASRVVTTALIFVLVRSESDVAEVVWLWSAPWLATALFSLWAVRYKLGVRFRYSSRASVAGALASGFTVFVSLAAASLYTAGNAVLLGPLTDNEEVGFFAAAETIVIAGVGLVGPLSQGLFPRAARAAEIGPEAVLAHARKALPFVGGLGVALFAFILVTAPFIGRPLFGSDFEDSVPLLQIMSVIPLAAALAAVFSIQLMFPLRMDRAYSAVIIGGGLLNVALTLALVPPFESLGTAIAAATTESLIACTLFVYLRRRGLNVFRRLDTLSTPTPPDGDPS
jgi:PST family polysaccharide transporter